MKRKSKLMIFLGFIIVTTLIVFVKHNEIALYLNLDPLWPSATSIEKMYKPILDDVGKIEIR